MTNNLYIVLAICVGQVPGGGSPYAPLGGGSSYSPSYQPAIAQPYQQPAAQPYQPAIAQPVYPQARPQAKGPLRSWFQNNLSSQKSKADCGCSSQTAATSPYTTIPARPKVTNVRVSHPDAYRPIPQGPSVPVITEVPVITQENIVPSAQPTVTYHHGEGVYHPEVYLQHDQTVPVEAPVEQPLDAQLQVAKKYENQVGHEEDYSWITGHLFFVHTDGGRWIVRYALPGEIDKYGGSVVLAPGVEMKNFREGDLVCIYGEILDEGRASRSLGGALYRVNSILMIERADP